MKRHLRPLSCFLTLAALAICSTDAAARSARLAGGGLDSGAGRAPAHRLHERPQEDERERLDRDRGEHDGRAFTWRCYATARVLEVRPSERFPPVPGRFDAISAPDEEHRNELLEILVVFDHEHHFGAYRAHLLGSRSSRPLTPRRPR